VAREVAFGRAVVPKLMKAGTRNAPLDVRKGGENARKEEANVKQDEMSK
jgi:hypothetical protein